MTITKDLFSGVLTFALLIGGTVAIGSEMFGLDRTLQTARSATASPLAIVTLPTVTVIGHRDVAVAVARADSAARIVE